MGETQEKLKKTEVTGSAGGGLVRVTVDGNFYPKKVRIDPVAVDPRDVPMLEELVHSASIDAFNKMREKLKEEIGRDLLSGFPS